MLMSLEDRDIIIGNSNFFVSKNYKMTYNNNSVSYSNKKISFIFSYERYSERSTVYIKFIKKNEYFNVGWIALVRNNIQNNDNRLNRILQLMKYIEENYKDITNIKYCRESDELISQYVRNRQNEEWKTIALNCNFLCELGYKYIREEYGLIYVKDNIVFSITYTEITISFIVEDETFDVRIMGLARKEIEDSSLQFCEKTLQTLQFLQKNYKDIIDIEYCRKSVQC
jgi:hypothetical protein